MIKYHYLLAEVDIGTTFGINFTGGAPSSIGTFITALLPQIYTIALVLVLIYLIWGAYRYMMSGGDPKAVALARSHLTWAIIGMIVIALSYGIFAMINALLNNAFTL